MYNQPYTIEEIIENYPDIAESLIKDPIHRWRAETVIELIHEEPTKQKLERIWINWQEMDEKQKVISDQMSIELFGVSNLAHYQTLIIKY